MSQSDLTRRVKRLVESSRNGPLGPVALSVTADKLRVVVPVAVIAILAVPGLLAVSIYDSGQRPPSPLGPQVPLEWTTDATGQRMHVLASVLPGSLPPPVVGQKRAGQCDPDAGEVELREACWIPVDGKAPPCPAKLYAYEGRCWRPVVRAARPQQSGEPRGPVVGAP